MKVIWFNGNFGNQIFYCAYKDYLKNKYPHEKVYAYIDKKCPAIRVEERTNLKIPRTIWWVNIMSFFVFKVVGVIFRRVPLKCVPKWYCGKGPLNDKATFIGHSLQESWYYAERESHWLDIQEPPMSVDSEYFHWIKKIANCHSVSVHLRRGDYVAPGSSYVDLSTTGYYQKAMDYAKSIFPDAEFFFFSDDLDFVKSMFHGDNIHYVDCNKGSRGYLDIKLMSLAKINIIANSTFSYWGAYINHEEKTVIYPKQWFCEWTGRSVPDIMMNKWKGF
jgi:hypothetical protein